MSKILRLPAIRIDLPVPENLEFFDEGFSTEYEFFNKIWNQRYGRDLRMLEISQMGIGCGQPASGEFFTYSSNPLDKRFDRIHIYLARELIDNFPLRTFVGGHEEAHILQPTVLNRYDLLNTKLAEIGTNRTVETQPSGDLYDQMADVGGLVAMHFADISVGNSSDPNWQKFLNDFPRNSEQQFRNALELFLDK